MGMVRLWGERFVFRGFFESMAPTPFFRVGCDASSTEHVCLCARFLFEKRSKTPVVCGSFWEAFSNGFLTIVVELVPVEVRCCC